MGYIVEGAGPKGLFVVEVDTASAALADARLGAEGLKAAVSITDPEGRKYALDEFAATIERGRRVRNCAQ